MNDKYQEALDELRLALNRYTCYKTSGQDKENLATLQELIDKEKPKKVGDLKCCNEIKCEQCPLRGVCSTMMAFPPMKLYDILKRYGVHKNTYFDQEIYDLLKSRLDVEVK